MVVPEAEELDSELILDGDDKPTFIWTLPVGGSVRRLGVLSYTGVEVVWA